MSPLYWKLGLTAIIGAAVGAVSGQATIAGMAAPPPSRFAAVADPSPIGRPYAADPDAAAGPAAGDYARIADACETCSDYELGYRFAAARGLRETAQCLDYSWSYQRGCLAFLREG